MCPIKQGETPVTDVERTQDTKNSEAGLTTNIVEQLRSELSRLRKFIGYDKIDTVDGKTGQYVFNPKAYENIFGYENQTTEKVDSETSEKQINVLTLLDYIYLIVQKDLSQDENDKDFETRVTENKNKIDQILSWLNDQTDEDGKVIAKGVLSKVQSLWSDVTNATNGLKVQVSSQDQRIQALENLINKGWDEENENGSVSYEGYKTIIKNIYNELSSRVTETILSNTLSNYYQKSEVDSRFVAKETGKRLSTNDYTNEDANTVSELRASGWVRPVAGKDLSTEDFTTELKTKLDGIAAQANKTEITSTVTSDTNKVPSCAAVSAALAGKLNTSSKASGIDDDNKNNDDIIPSVKAVAAYVDSNISGAMDFATVKDKSASAVSISNETEGLCAVRVTKMSDGTTQYQSSVNALGVLINQTTTFTFNIETSAHYMIEAWTYNSGTQKLVPAAVKFI